jgi:3-oxoacyl-[acyl-carrier-protein] synthase II
MCSKRIAITGVGLVTPLGIGVEENWSALLSGASGIDEVTLFDAARLPSRIAGEVKNFNPEGYLDLEGLSEMSRSIQFALVASAQAFKDAGLSSPQGVAAERFGVNVGVGLGLNSSTEALRRGGECALSPNFISNFLGNMASSRVGSHWNLKGPMRCTSTACASGTHAIGMAIQDIQRGVADVMIAGGTEACLFELTMGGFCAMRILSMRNEEPKKASRPFDSGRDGFVIAEGAGMLILEDLEKAKARGAKIHAEIKGFGMSSNSYHFIHPDPDGEGPVLCMEMTLRDAGVLPEDVGYINAHGTATVQNDRVETLAIKRVFGEHAYGLAVSSTKSMTGHLLGASGAVETIYSTLALHHQILPPTINYQDPEPDCDLDYIPNTARKANVKYALKNSFGFGGQNASLLLARYDGN